MVQCVQCNASSSVSSPSFLSLSFGLVDRPYQRNHHTFVKLRGWLIQIIQTTRTTVVMMIVLLIRFKIPNWVVIFFLIISLKVIVNHGLKQTLLNLKSMFQTQLDQSKINYSDPAILNKCSKHSLTHLKSTLSDCKHCGGFFSVKLSV